MTSNTITVEALRKVSGKSEATITKIRAGHSPNLRTMKALAAGCAQILGRPVELADLFDLSVSVKRTRKAA